MKINSATRPRGPLGEATPSSSNPNRFRQRPPEGLTGSAWRAALAGALCLFGSAAAAAPKVMTDIAPVQSLAARVMAGVGAPGVLLPAGASPHHYALRPSDAAALQGADLVVWIGEGLTPWLPRVLDRLSGAVALELAEAPGVIPIEAHDDLSHGAADEHGHGAEDPHFWLDPRNAAAMAAAIAEALAALDAPNAALYRANAAAADAELRALQAEIETVIAPVRGRGFLLAHDALGYFEGRFDLEAAGALADAGDARPGPARAEAALARIAAGEIVCIFTDPAHDSALAERLAEGRARVVALDPLGAGLAPGPELYPAMMRRLGADIAECLGE